MFRKPLLHSQPRDLDRINSKSNSKGCPAWLNSIGTAHPFGSRDWFSNSQLTRSVPRSYWALPGGSSFLLLPWRLLRETFYLSLRNVGGKYELFCKHEERTYSCLGGSGVEHQGLRQSQEQKGSRLLLTSFELLNQALPKARPASGLFSQKSQ